ncbi:immunity 8 family protein [Streptomyces polyrhachis]|uniref:Immunity 8 family protein n=1 Tax=Streptomyces polyrhachis TaxID=1282885 RepID=A0ABW2GJM5_9ACTN
MKAVVRHFLSPDVDFNTYWPEDVEDVGFLVQMLVGPEGGPGEESFGVMVCTPRWLGREVQRSGPLIARHFLVIPEYDPPKIQEFLRNRVEAFAASTWTELAEKIGRIGYWEFEDYAPE